MAPSDRLSQITSHLSSDSKKEHAVTFRPKLPAGLPPSFTPLNPLTFLLKSASIRPNHPAIVHPEKGLQWTFAEWATRVSNFAYALKKNGIKKGDRVMVICPNTPACADALQAIPAAQGVIVAINTRLTPPEVEYLIENSGASLILVDSEYAKLVGNTKVPVVVCNDSGKSDDPYEKFLVEGAEYDKKLGGLGWEGHEFVGDEMTTFAISYTSGTTSRPKGVETTYRGTYLAAIGNAVESSLTPSSRYLWILPMFHCLGWCFPYACTMRMATQLCLRGVGDYSEVWKGILERGVTNYSGAPTVQLSIVSHKMAKKLDRPLITNVAGAAPTSTLIRGLEGLGIEVCHVYGLTETYGPMSRVYFDDKSDPSYYEKKAQQGAAFLTADDIRIVRLIPEGEELKVKEGDLQEVRNDGSEVGEIVSRGNITMKGYYKNADATARAFAGGYFHSGDLAVRFPDGSYNIQDRAKDIIISGGENISSLFCESVLSTHPDVHEVAVVARSDEKWGERPHAFVVLKDGKKWHGKHADFSSDLKRHVTGKLPKFAVPAWVEIVPELEKTSTGKVQKKVLRDNLKKALAKL